MAMAAQTAANGPYKFRRGAAVLVQAGCRWEYITATVGGGGQMPVIINGQQMNKADANVSFVFTREWKEILREIEKNEY